MALTAVDICNMAIYLLGGEAIASLDEVTTGGKLANLFYDKERDAVLRARPWNFAKKMTALIPVPTALTAALISPAIAGNVDNGDHKYYVTYVHPRVGETNFGASSGTITVADKAVNGKVALSNIPLGPSGTTARKIYRSKAGNDFYFYLLTTIENNTATTYTDNTADSGLTGTAKESDNAPLYGYTYQYQLPSDYLFMVEMEDSIPPTYPWKIFGKLLLTDNSSPNVTYIYQVTDVTKYDFLFVDALASRLACKFCKGITGKTDDVLNYWKLYQQELIEAATVDGMEGTPEEYPANALIDVR